MEKQRMMADNELATVHNSLINNRLCYIGCQENGMDITFRVTYLYSRVIPFALGTPWHYRFYAINDLP